VDNRGFFSETYSVRDFANLGIHDTFVQDNHSFSVEAGTLRGLHLQVPPLAQAKLVRVVRGAVIDVALDIRRASPTYGRHVAVRLSAEHTDQIYVPIGFAHGFMATEPNTEVLYKVSNPYSLEHQRGIAFDDPALGINWGIDLTAAILSDRDREHPALAEFASPF
jgi:dTDP-4-dehydrorhamnose 3,5-epimerase